MSSQSSYRRDGSTDGYLNAYLAPALAFSMWNPFLAAALRGNAQAHEGFGTLASEWQTFVSCRLKEDFRLVQRLTQSRTPDQVMTAYTEFWHKAAEDYGRELNAMTKVMAGVINKTAVVTQSATNEANTTLFSSRKAA